MGFDPKKYEALLPVVLELYPISSTLHLYQTFENSVSPSISMDLRLSKNSSVHTTRDHSLDHVNWSITLHEGEVSDKYLKQLGAIGLLEYGAAFDDDDEDVGAPERSFLWAHIGARSFALLWDVVREGRLPDSILVDARGLTHGSPLIWDVKEDEKVPLYKVELFAELRKIIGPKNQPE